MKTITKFVSAAFAVVILSIAALTANAAPGDIFVSDRGNGVIYKFTPDGTQSTFAAGLTNPEGLAFDSAGYLFVADEYNGLYTGTIYKFAPDGTRSTFATAVTSYGPLVLSFDSAGYLFMSDDGGHTIYKFAPDGTQSTFAYDPVMYPAGLAFDSAGYLFVGGDGNGTIYKFAPDATRSTFATGFDRYFAPLGLAFDTYGYLFVSDWSYGIIYKFAPDATHSTFATGITTPYGLAFDSAGYLFVAAGDFYGNIYKFAPDGTRSQFAALGDPNHHAYPTYIAIQPGTPSPTPTPTPTATPTPTVRVTVQTNPAGLTLTVDGTSYSSTQRFTWASGSSHTVTTTSPQSGGTGVQYVWTNWNDHGAISHTVAPTTNTTYTAKFKTQYYLTMTAGTGGRVSPTSGWRNSGAAVSISARPANGYSFSNWTGSGTGSYSGMNNPASITMGGPITETATFTHN